MIFWIFYSEFMCAVYSTSDSRYTLFKTLLSICVLRFPMRRAVIGTATILQVMLRGAQQDQDTFSVFLNCLV